MGLYLFIVVTEVSNLEWGPKNIAVFPSSDITILNGLTTGISQEFKAVRDQYVNTFTALT